MGRGALTYTLNEIEFYGLSDDDLTSLLDVTNLLDRESQPRHVDLTLDEFRIMAESPGMCRHRYLVHDEDGRIAGMATFSYPDDASSPDTLMCQIRVLPEQRRKGIGIMLLEKAVDLATDLQRKTLQSFIVDTVPAGHEFVCAVGAEEKLNFHENVLRIADLDRQLLQTWANEGPERAPGYSVQLIHGLWPEDLFDDIAHLFHVLERDMPMSDSFEPAVWNAQRVSELQDHWAESFDSLSTIAIHDETGTAVGMSDMIRRKTEPTTWIVTTTMVDPAHRGRSLGKWLKGAINLAALDRWDGGIYQETGNAFINEPMLAINRAMGFEHEVTMTDCSLNVEDARGYLASRARSARKRPGT